VDGKVVSSNVLYFVPAKQVRLPASRIATELSADGASYRLRLTSNALARRVYVSFGDTDTPVSDNYFDLIPSQPVDITIQSKVGEDELRRALKVISLAEAFAPPGAVPQN
jgi:beta-mannosidase